MKSAVLVIRKRRVTAQRGALLLLYLYPQDSPSFKPTGGEANYKHLGDSTATARQIDVHNTNSIR